MPPRVSADVVAWQLSRLAAVPSAGEWLAELARRAPGAIRLAAVRALAQGGCATPACRSALTLASAAHAPALRIAAVQGLGRLKGVPPERLVLLLTDPAPRLRAVAALALARLGGPTVYDALLGGFRKSRESYLIEAFAVLGDPRAEKVLLALLREEHSPLRSGERLAVIEALERLGTKASIDRLVLELEHPEPALRLAAARVLYRVGDRRALDGLAACAEDFYQVVRQACAAARRRIEKGR
jgi:HEAT repeat protein